MTRAVFVVGLLLALATGPAAAQQPDTARTGPPARAQGQGTATLEGWPPSLPQLLREMGPKAPYLLPRIDSLGLNYRYASTDSTSRWSFVLGWQAAERVLYQGEILPVAEAPSDLRMTNVELRADVISGGRKVGEMIIAVDSMRLRSLPSIYTFEVAVGHDRVFLDTPPGAARRALARGITLRNLVVERMGFSTPEDARSARPPQAEPDDRPREAEPRRAPRVYEPRTSILVGWRIAPRPYYVGDNGDRTSRSDRANRPRGDTIGRTADAGEETDGRSRGGDGDGEGRRGGGESTPNSGDDGDDEDEDTPDLRAPALVAAGTVALVAAVGRTIGVYGTGDTPLGLAAGITKPSGGLQLQAAVNTAVLGNDPGQKLTVKALGFYDAFGARVQPALGLGVQANPDRQGDVGPSVSAGVVGNFGHVVLYGGVDVVQQAPEVGLAVNLRYGGTDEDQ